MLVLSRSKWRRCPWLLLPQKFWVQFTLLRIEEHPLIVEIVLCFFSHQKCHLFLQTPRHMCLASHGRTWCNIYRRLCIVLVCSSRFSLHGLLESSDTSPLFTLVHLEWVIRLLHYHGSLHLQIKIPVQIGVEQRVAFIGPSSSCYLSHSWPFSWIFCAFQDIKLQKFTMHRSWD